MMYHCKNCDWVGEEPFADRDGDAYAPDTQWYYLCPLCFEPVEEIKDNVSKNNSYGQDC